jgi:hypothetical protein
MEFARTSVTLRLPAGISGTLVQKDDRKAGRAAPVPSELHVVFPARFALFSSDSPVESVQWLDTPTNRSCSSSFHLTF